MADRVEDRPSLKDLDGVRVAVDEPIPPPLSRDTLRADVESQLRAAGIRIVGMGEFPTGDPHLRVTISVSAPQGAGAGRMVGCAVQLDFVQIVFMRRNPAVTFNRAQTWKADAQVLLVAEAGLTDAVRRELTRQVEQFIADYRAANA